MDSKLPSLPTRLLVLACTVSLAACGSGSQTSQGTEPTFEVDPTVQPDAESIAFIDDSGERQVATIVDDRGHQIDFVEDEVILTLQDRDELPAILERLNGAVIREVDPNVLGLLSERAPIFVLVRVDAPEADPSELQELIMEQGRTAATIVCPRRKPSIRSRPWRAKVRRKAPTSARTFCLRMMT